MSKEQPKTGLWKVKLEFSKVLDMLLTLCYVGEMSFPGKWLRAGVSNLLGAASQNNGAWSESGPLFAAWLLPTLPLLMHMEPSCC